MEGYKLETVLGYTQAATLKINIALEQPELKATVRVCRAFNCKNTSVIFLVGKAS